MGRSGLGRYDGHRAVRVVQQGVPHRAGTRRAGAPADDHQVRPGGQPGQRAGRVTVHDLVRDRHIRVLGPALVEQAGQLPGGVRRGLGAGFGEELAGPGDLGLRRVPGVHRVQARVPQAGLLEREGERVAAAIGVGDADADEPVRGRRLVPDDHDRAGRVAGGVPADRAEQQGGERAGAARAEHQHQRARPALGDGLRRRSGQLVGVDQHAGGCLGGPFGRHGQRPVTVFDENVGHRLVLARARVRPHPGQQPRGGHDPQRGTAQGRFPRGPADRLQ